MEASWSDILKQLTDHQALSIDQTELLIIGFLNQTIPPELAGAILIALQWKGLNAQELATMAKVVKSLSPANNFSSDLASGFSFSGQAIDTCGTGGDGAHTFNISTCTAFVVAAAGVPVAKHGGRSVSSRAGSADVLEILGINLAAPTAKIHNAVEAIGITFLFAPHWHPAMKAVAGLRRSLGVRTLFNLIGPLVNPLSPPLQVMGVYSRDLTEMIAETLKILGRDRAVVLHSREGMDEAGLGDHTDLAILANGKVYSDAINPLELGLAPANLDALKGGDVKENAEILKAVLQGKGTLAQTNCVALNSAIAFWVAGKVDSWQSGLDLAQSILVSGSAWQKLEQLKNYLN
jgi:anthranilate phosphoribosyltransferase